jgi:hypothetical protein
MLYNRQIYLKAMKGRKEGYYIQREKGKRRENNKHFSEG